MNQNTAQSAFGLMRQACEEGETSVKRIVHQVKNLVSPVQRVVPRRSYPRREYYQKHVPLPKHVVHDDNPPEEKD